MFFYFLRINWAYFFLFLILHEFILLIWLTYFSLACSEKFKISFNSVSNSGDSLYKFHTKLKPSHVIKYAILGILGLYLNIWLIASDSSSNFNCENLSYFYSEETFWRRDLFLLENLKDLSYSISLCWLFCL